MDAVSDLELVNRLADSNGAAFNAFYGRYAKLIYYSIQKMEKDLTEDIFQDFFVWLQYTQYRALRCWNRSSPLPNFLRQVVRNFALDRLRSQKRYRDQKGSDALRDVEIASGTPRLRKKSRCATCAEARSRRGGSWGRHAIAD